jgi:hypothetical protein
VYYSNPVPFQEIGSGLDVAHVLCRDEQATKLLYHFPYWTNCCVTTIRDYGKEIF